MGNGKGQNLLKPTEIDSASQLIVYRTRAEINSITDKKNRKIAFFPYSLSFKFRPTNYLNDSCFSRSV